MKNGLKVFDADAHVLYPRDLWSRFLDPRFRDRVVRADIAALGPGHYPHATRVDGRWTQTPLQLTKTILAPKGQHIARWSPQIREQKYGELITKGFTGARVAKALAVEGVDVSVVYGPEYDLWLEGIAPELQAAMARAYNRWGQEMREDSGGRVHVSGPIPLNDVSRAVEEIRYAYDNLGTRCFWARPNVFNHRNLGNRHYDPIWELLQDLDCAFGTHEFMGVNGPSAGSERFVEGQWVEWHTVVHAHEAQSAIVSMIARGVFERFPRLRCAYLEAGCGWLPSWLHRIDEQLEMAGGIDTDQLSMSATDYFKRNCWISTECEDPFAADVVRWLGDDHIVFETDFPHPDSKYPHVLDEFLENPHLTLESKRKVLWDNAVDFYRFPKDCMPTKFEEAVAAVV